MFHRWIAISGPPERDMLSLCRFWQRLSTSLINTEARVPTLDGAALVGGIDQCLGCGVEAYDFSDHPAVADHGPLPLSCPGPTVDAPHVFDGFHAPDGQWLTCVLCELRIGPDTDPTTVGWECPARKENWHATP